VIDRLEELKQSLVDMSPEERLEKLREIRDDRKVSKHAVTVKAKREQDKGAKVKKMFAGMSPEDQAEFLKGLTNEDATDKDC
jgi:flagellar motility protein MotE (MotC chaperone)